MLAEPSHGLVEDLYLLAGIAPPDIRGDVCARMEKTKQETNEGPLSIWTRPCREKTPQLSFASWTISFTVDVVTSSLESLLPLIDPFFHNTVSSLCCFTFLLLPVCFTVILVYNYNNK